VLRIGLTGGIGSGKSTVARLFASRGAPILDADELARELVSPGTPALGEILAAFGDGILDADGALDRRRLRERVFSDSVARKRLEAIVHPRIREAMLERLEGLEADYAILVIPLLLEAAQQQLVDRVLVVDLPESLQIERAAARDGVDAAAIRHILDVQCRRGDRLRAADDVIDNSLDPDRLAIQVDRLDRRYRALAGDPGNGS